jgi:hypothetical protein
MLPLITGSAYIAPINALLRSVYGNDAKLNGRAKLETVCSNDCYLYEAGVANIYLKQSTQEDCEGLLVGLMVGRARNVFTLEDGGVLVPGTHSRYSAGAARTAAAYSYAIADECPDLMDLCKRANVVPWLSTEAPDILGFYIADLVATWEALEATTDLVSVRTGSTTYTGETLGNFVYAPYNGIIVKDIGGF